MELMDHVKRPIVDGVKLQIVGSKSGVVETGCICITAFHFIFSTRKQTEQDEITVLHIAIDHIEHKAATNLALLVLKDFRRFLFEFPTPDDCQDMVEALEALSKPEHLQQLYAFNYSPRDTLPSTPWQFRTLNDLFIQWKCSPERFRITSVNKGFKICPSYPEESIVPASVSDEDLKKVASFRHLGRFPVVCFHHKKNKAVLLRCGQPLCGPSHKKCKEDVMLLNACLPSLSKGKVLDIRPQSVAQAHMSKGGGIEYPSNYSQWKVEYAKIETPAIMQQSLSKLTEACFDSSLATSSAWFGRLEASGWLTHITRLLQSARFISLTIHKDGSSVVVHGAGSRDGTLQVTALSQVLLDPHCRTMQGFIELVQREWLDGGHPFSIRHKYVKSVPEKDKAPVFLLFLDAVWQIMQQYPLSFEFNELFLHSLFVHSYYSIYGNFLYDNPKERVKNQLHEKTHCLWNYLAQPNEAGPMLNPLYEKNSSVLLITVTALNVTLWKRLYLRCDARAGLTVPNYEAIKLLKDENAKLKQDLADVKKELEEKQLQGRKYATNWS